MFFNGNGVFQQVEGGVETQVQPQTEDQKEHEEIREEDDVKPAAVDSSSDFLSEQIRAAATDDGHSQSTNRPPPKTHSGISLESVQSITHSEYFQINIRVV